MENEDLIREQMTDTRTSMTNKLEKLEQKVAGTVTDATGAVQDTVQAVKETVEASKDAVTETVDSVKETVTGTVEAVKGTVEAVKDTVQETIGAVKETVKGGVDAVKDFLDIPKQTQRHPWIVMGGAVLSGFVLGKALGGARPRTAVSIPPSRGETGPLDTAQPQAEASRGPQRRGLIESLAGQFAPEITQLKNMAIAMAMNALRDAVSKNVPADWSPQVTGILDSVTAKLTGGQERGEVERDAAAHEHGDGHHGNGHDSRRRHRSHQRGKFDRQ
ncbi:MAG: hypothetical protein U0793_25425 [Gemmataceae bacterium]